MATYRIPTDAIPEEQRGGGPVDPDTIASTIATDAQGNQKRRPFPATSMTYLGTLTDVAPELRFDAVSICQLAIYRVLGGIVMHRTNFEAYVATGDIQTASFQFRRLIFDWPRDEEQIKPMPSAAIVAAGEVEYANPDLGTDLLEDTVDVYREGSVLRRLSHATMRLVAHMLFAHKEERRAAHSAIERELLAEPDDDEGHRKVVIPEYYDRTVRMMLRSLARPDGADEAKTNTWELQAAFDCEVEVVKLVTDPGRIQQPILGAQVGTTVVP